ncbi:hypothetical protein [Anaerovibrio sp.]|uniref:hypothetical protein n=1 Tax=Anaerovibrio sp. TaxID=1872532 RepID=UPI003890359B
MNKRTELREMELNQVAGGRPRITLHGPRRNDLKRITEIVHDVKKIIKGIYDKVEELKPKKPEDIVA